MTIKALIAKYRNELRGVRHRKRTAKYRKTVARNEGREHVLERLIHDLEQIHERC